VGHISWLWAGCFGPAQRNSVVFHLFKKIQMDLNRFNQKMTFPNLKIQMKYGLNKEQFSLFKLYKIQNGF
jgi:hypothetical protein